MENCEKTTTKEDISRFLLTVQTWQQCCLGQGTFDVITVTQRTNKVELVIVLHADNISNSGRNQFCLKETDSVKENNREIKQLEKRLNQLNWM